MILDAFLAVIHHLCVFGLFVILAAEMTLVRPGISAETVMRVVRINGLYGILAGLALVAGGLRVFYAANGAAFYTHNPVFWIHLGLFLVSGSLMLKKTTDKKLSCELASTPDRTAT